MGRVTHTCELIVPLFPFLRKLGCGLVEPNDNTMLGISAPRTVLYFNAT
jgi:hypothetical protein